MASSQIAIMQPHPSAPHQPLELHSLTPGSVRKLLCAAKQPFGQCTQILLNDYFEHNRKHEARWVAPAKRCSARVGRGRCRKHVSEAALCQFCWKHGNSWVGNSWKWGNWAGGTKDEYHMVDVDCRRSQSDPNIYQLMVDTSIEDIQEQKNNFKPIKGPRHN